MTVPASLANVEYITDGVSLQFTYPFKISDGNELEVRHHGTVLTETVDYSVLGEGDDNGGSILFFIAPTVGILSLRRVLLFEQLLDLIPNGALPAEAMEFRLDQIVKMIQQLKEELSRKVGFAVGSKAAFRDVMFPLPGEGKLLGWAEEGDILTLYDATLRQIIPDEVSGISYGISVVAVPTVAGAWILTAVAAIPVGVEVIGVTYFCSAAFGTGNGLTSVDIGWDGLQDGWGREVGIEINNVTGPGNFKRGDHPTMAAAADLTITANGGQFDAIGSALLTIHWRNLSPRTSL